MRSKRTEETNSPGRARFRSTESKGASADWIARELEGLIASGRLASGDRMRERALAHRFGVSRGPVREALRLLESRGLICIEPMRGAAVRQLADDDVLELMDIGAALIALAANRAARRRTAREAEGLVEAAEMLLKDAPVLDPPCFSERTSEIARLAIGLARSPHLARMAQDVVWRGVPVIAGPCVGSTKQKRVQSSRNWLRLAQAIAQGRGPQAERLARRLCLQSRKAFLCARGGRRLSA